MLPALLNEKSGLQATFLGILIITVIAVFFVGGIIFNKIGASSRDMLIDQTCKNSVKLHAYSHIKSFDKAVTDINCPTKYKTIEQSDEEKKKKELANELFGCWNKFWEGQYELFEEPKIYCAVCSVITFENKEPITRFTEYLTETDAPLNKGKYFDYLSGYSNLSGYSTEDAFKFEDLKKTTGLEVVKTETLDTNNQQAAIFVYAKGTDAMQRLYEYTIGNPAAFGATLAGLGIAAVGVGVVVSSTTIGSIVGVPIIIVGGTISVAAGIADWITADKVEPEWASVVILREYNREQLLVLCDYVAE